MNFISDILTFAYRGSGKSILLICVILSVIASIASFAPIFGIIAWILFTGYFCSIFYQIIRSSAIGGMEAPNFPETSNILEDVIVPMLQVILVVMVSFAPYFVYTLFISSDHPDPMISNIFFGFGVIYFPMAMLAVVILGSIRALSPHIVLPAIFHGGWIYWGGVLMLTILYVMCDRPSSLLEFFRLQRLERN